MLSAGQAGDCGFESLWWEYIFPFSFFILPKKIVETRWFIQIYSSEGVRQERIMPGNALIQEVQPSKRPLTYLTWLVDL